MMRSRILRFSPGLLSLCALCFAASVVSQEAAAPPVPDAAAIEERLKSLLENPDIDEATGTKLTEVFDQALEQLRSATEWQTQGAQYADTLKNADATIAALQTELVQPLEDLSGAITPDDPSAAIEQRVADADGALAAAQAELGVLEQESAHRAERRRQIPELQAAARQRQAEVQAELAAPPSGEGEALVEARRTLAGARAESVRQELLAYDQEIASYDARGRVLSLRLDNATRRADHLKREGAELREQLAARRQEEAIEAARRAREALLEANNAPEEIRTLAESLAAENTRLTQELAGPDGLIRRTEAAGERLAQVKEQLNTLASDFTALKAKVDAAGIGTGTGALLRSHQRNLPDMKHLEKNIRERQRTIGKTQIEQIECEEARRRLADIDSIVRDTLDGLPAESTDAQREDFAKVLRALYETQRQVLDDKIEDYEYYFATLIDLDAQEQQLINQTAEFQNYITERVLWLRSGDIITLDEAGDIEAAARWFTRPANVRALAHALLSDLSASPFPVAACVLAILILNAFRWHFRRRIAAAAEIARRHDCMVIRPTIESTVYSLLVSLGLPLLIGLIGWRASVSLASTEYTRALGGAVGLVAFFLWSLEFPREVLRPHGLGMAHFGWSESSCRNLARRILALELVTFPLVLAIAALESLGEQRWQETAGRFALVVILLCLTLFGHLVLRRRNGPLLEIIERARKRANLHLRRLWYALAVLAPLVLMLAAAYGYAYSAVQIATQVHYSLLCAFCLTVIVHLVLRWMLVARRHMARAQARKKLESVRESGSDLEIPAAPAEDVDLDKIDAQALRLIRSCFALALALCGWWIWADDLPALSVLNRVELWTVTDTITAERTAAGGERIVDSREEQVPITLRHLAAFLFIAGITIIAVQNLPGLLEILVWQRMSMMAGERYAANTIIAYILTLIGGTWAFSAVGLSWGKLQWLFAAVGLGLGFGLQEIFANLVSGIILLFERPIRVGDVVTVGDVSGTVSRIRIRATWITAFNRQELIVPNKEFVTGRLINWTLSDRVIRLEVPVGIAYGSDIALAKQLMLDVAERCPSILDDPAPVVFFRAFGASSLDFELRAHCTDVDNALGTKDQLLTGIDAAFREHHIEIPFPQSDVHVRSIRATLPVEKGGDPPLR